MKIAVVHDWEPDIEQELTWRDGLAAAIRILSQRHQIEFFTLAPKNYFGTRKSWNTVIPHPYFNINFIQTGEVAEGNQEGFSPWLALEVQKFKPDVILHWADMTRPNAKSLKSLGKPMAICFAGGQPFGPNWALFDHIFVESNSYLMQYQNRGLGDQVSTAFGTNTKLFDPNHAQVKNQRKIFDACFPATYCDWKRHRLFADAVKGHPVVCAGFKYEDHETYCWEAADAAGALSLPHVSAETLRQIYASSRTCIVTSHWTGGSQRTVLEAMAMNVPLVVMSDSDKTSEYVLDCGEGLVVPPEPNAIREAMLESMGTKVNTRDYILSKWSENHYADALEAGLKKIV